MAKNTNGKNDTDINDNPDLEGVPSWLVEAARTVTPKGSLSCGLYGKNDGTRRGRTGRKSHNKFDD